MKEKNTPPSGSLCCKRKPRGVMNQTRACSLRTAWAAQEAELAPRRAKMEAGAVRAKGLERAGCAATPGGAPGAGTLPAGPSWAFTWDIRGSPRVS